VNAFEDVAPGMRKVFGGRSKSYESELSSGVDIDYETVGNNMLMVSASGTAVRLA
jgi:uncharacterized protein YbjQ (UPF0145 family)